MNVKAFSRIGVCGGVGCVGYVLGVFIERSRVIHEIERNTEVIPNLPGLPIFGTVSAATPFQSNTLIDSPSQDVLSNKSRVRQIMKFGFPSLDNIRSFDNFVLSYDKRNRVAHWVFEHLSADCVKRNDSVDRSKCEFTEDNSIHKYFRSTNADYKGSGFDRGHLAAAGNHKVCQQHVEQTFLLSNMAPQVGKGFNRDSWNRLEKYVRKLTRVYPNVYVCTGPLYLPKVEADGKTYVNYQVIGVNHVAVPTHFFKIVVMESHDSKLHLEAFVMPNMKIDDNTPLSSFLVPPESIERASGLLFLDGISKNNLVQVNGRKTTYV